MTSLAQLVNEKMPEINVEGLTQSEPEPLGPHTKLRIVHYVATKENVPGANKAVEYIFKEGAEYRSSLDYAATFSENGLRLASEVGSIRKLDKPVFIKENDKVRQATENTFYVRREDHTPSTSNSFSPWSELRYTTPTHEQE